MKIKAAVLTGLNEPIEIMELVPPPLGEGQVLVEIHASGVCHTQLSEARGRRGPDKFLPHTLGHEGSGTVLETGSGVSKVKAGDRVVLTWIKGSGKTVPGLQYESGGRKINSGALSTFMTHTVTCESRLVKIPEGLPLREAALLGCAVPTGAGIVFNTADLKAGATVAVFGAGGIGLSAVMAASARGAGLVAAVDVAAGKLDLARELGATETVDASGRDPVAAILEWTGGKGVDLAVETAGRPETMEKAFEATRAGGGLCVLAGNLPAGGRISIDPFELIKGKRLVGTWGGETDPDRDIPKYAEMFLAGKLKLGRLMTHGFPLEGVNEALAALEDGKVGRAMLDMKG